MRLLAPLGCLVLSLSFCTPEPAATLPNILLILADDLGYGDLSLQD